MFLIPAAVSAGACALGWRLAQRRWLNPWLLIAVALAVGLLAGAYVAGRDADVHTGAVVAGVILASLFLGAVPVLLYYWLGRALARNPPLLAIAWFLTLLPLYVYSFFAVVFTVKLVACPPDAYECPF